MRLIVNLSFTNEKNFFLMKSLCYFTLSCLVPPTPIFEDTKCEIVGNTLSLEWSLMTSPSTSLSAKVENYVIEVDDGMGGDFQEVHRTPDMFCTLGGLQFDSTYRARVRATNEAGESCSSHEIVMSTPESKFCFLSLKQHFS